jgi:hypothetical protein
MKHGFVIIVDIGERGGHRAGKNVIDKIKDLTSRPEIIAKIDTQALISSSGFIGSPG